MLTIAHSHFAALVVGATRALAAVPRLNFPLRPIEGLPHPHEAQNCMRFKASASLLQAVTRDTNRRAGSTRRFLDVFGSASRAEDLDARNSDADFLVEFAPNLPVRLPAFFGAKAGLEQLMGMGVDLVEPDAIRNSFVLSGIDRSCAPI